MQEFEKFDRVGRKSGNNYAVTETGDHAVEEEEGYDLRDVYFELLGIRSRRGQFDIALY